MPCYHPITAYYSADLNENGKHYLVFDSRKSMLKSGFQIPCGKCIGCKLEYSRQWAIRLMNEEHVSEFSHFLTLTYDDYYLPDDLSLNKKHFQDFMKRLRKRFKSSKLRYFHCGEYGETTQRPHYHCILFGLDVPDLVLYKRTDSGDLYNSDILTNVWGMGHVVIGNVTFDSCAYVARYVTKKLSSSNTQDLLDKYGDRQPEYATMSRRPGIGTEFVHKYSNDLLRDDCIVSRGFESSLPRQYDKILSDIDQEKFMDNKRARIQREFNREDFTGSRLAVKEYIKNYKLKQLDELRKV